MHVIPRGSYRLRAGTPGEMFKEESPNLARLWEASPLTKGQRRYQQRLGKYVVRRIESALEKLQHQRKDP